MKTLLRILIDSGGAPRSSDAGYSVDQVAKYLASLGKARVYTEIGEMPAEDAARHILFGSLKNVVVPGGPTLKVVGLRVLSSSPLQLPGDEEGDLTYSEREIMRVKMSDLLLLMGVETSSAVFRRDPGLAAVKAVETYIRERERGSPFHYQLKSALRNLLDVLSDVILMREGDRTDTLTSSVLRKFKSGEFEEVCEYSRDRLHLTRTLIRYFVGNPKEVFKSFVETGHHYVVVFDRSGSMSDVFMGATKKAFASLVVLLIAKADPEATYSLVVFDVTARTLLSRASADEVVDSIVGLEAGGGTSYSSGLAAASRLMSEGDILLVVGDFMDWKPVPEWVSRAVRVKSGKVLLVPVGEYDYEYASYLARVLGGTIYTYVQGRFLAVR